MSKNGKLVISLDFELIWGVFDHVVPEEKEVYFNNTRQLIPKLLAIFAENKIQVTWATVGMLANENWEEWLSNIPEDLPLYTNSKYDAYAFGLEQLKSKKINSFFAPDLITSIVQTPYQELATHTYSHYYCLEAGQTESQFQTDLELACKLTEKWNLSPTSLVFPRNQYNEGYLTVCEKLGITTVRTNPDCWYWQENSIPTMAKKIARTADAYIDLGRKDYPVSLLTEEEGVQLQPASRFLRPYSSKFGLHDLHLKRVEQEMTLAAKNGTIYHLWWHPHNFGNHPEQSLHYLSKIIKLFHKLNQEYGFESHSMSNVG